MKAKRNLLIAGSGFLGSAAAEWFGRKEWAVTVLTRSPDRIVPPAVAVRWDGQSRGDWEAALREADVLINFCGQSVNCRYHAANRRAILESRVRPTRLLGEALAGCPTPPRVWLNAASATIYRHAEDRGMSEAEGELKSRRIVPRRLQNAGFTWRFSTIPSALENLARRHQVSYPREP